MSADAALLDRLRRAGTDPDAVATALALTIAHFQADTGTVHLLGKDGALHLAAHQGHIPEPVLRAIRTIPVGRGMAGLAVARAAPVTTCNLQSDTSGDVRPGARPTGIEGAIVVPILRGDAPIGAFGIGCRAPREFSAAETALLLAAARIIASAATGKG